MTNSSRPASGASQIALRNLQQAATQLVEGLDRIAKLPLKEQVDAMREVSSTLIEMRRAADEFRWFR